MAALSQRSNAINKGKRINEKHLRKLYERKNDKNTKTFEIERGCLQGSSLGPTLWLMIMQGWFQKMNEAIQETNSDIHRQAFADDQVIIIADTSVKKIEVTWRTVWEKCQEWAGECKASYNKSKTEILFIANGKSIREPNINIDNEQIRCQNHIKLLGLTIDKKLNYIEHIRKTRRKMGEITTRIMGTIRKKLGKDRNLQKEIYNKILMPAFLYGCVIWGERCEDSRVIRHINAAQRLALKNIIHAYSTTPTAAPQVLAGTPPLAIEAKERYTYWQGWGDIIKTRKIKGKEKINPAQYHIITTIRTKPQVEHTDIYVDASHKETYTGIGICWEQRDGSIQTRQIKIAGINDTHTAELTAIKEGLKEGIANNINNIRIKTDRKGALNAVVTVNGRNKTTLDIQQQIIKETQKSTALK